MSSELVTQILLAVLACAWIGDFIRGLFQKKQVDAAANLSDANATQVIVASTTTLLKPLQDRVNELEDELREAKKQATRLVRQLETATEENRRITAENRMISDENRRLRLRIGES